MVGAFTGIFFMVIFLLPNVFYEVYHKKHPQKIIGTGVCHVSSEGILHFREFFRRFAVFFQHVL